MHPTDDELAALLRLLDHRPPEVDVETVIAAARRRPRIRVGAIAAGIVLCAAAAAAAIPGSPVRIALAHLFTSPNRPPAPVQPLAPDTAPGSLGTGIALVPGADFEIRFLNWQKSGQLRVLLVDTPRLSLVPRGGNAAFAVRKAEVAVDNRGSQASFTLEVPRVVQRLRVYVDTTVVLRKSAGAVNSLALPDSTGAFTFDLSSPPGIRPLAP